MEVSARQQLIVRVRLTMTMSRGKCHTCRGQEIYSGAGEGPHTLGDYFRKVWQLVSRRRTSRGAFQAKRRAGIKGGVYQELQLAPPGRSEGSKSLERGGCRHRQGQAPGKR